MAGGATMHFIGLFAALLIAVSARAAPPSEATGRYRDWFHSLTVPGSSTPCCTAADCRVVESRWNDRMQQYEAKVVRDMFSNALRNSPLYINDPEAFRKPNGFGLASGSPPLATLPRPGSRYPRHG